MQKEAPCQQILHTNLIKRFVDYFLFLRHSPPRHQTVSLEGSAAAGSNFVFFNFVGKEPVNLVACYGVVKVVKAPEKVNYALWAMESKRVSFGRSALNLLF